MPDASCELSVVVPTYCERDNVDPLIAALDAALRGIAWELVVVDDDSPDGTAAHVRSRAVRDPRIRVVQRVGRRGLSSACIEGILASAGPFVAVIDADLQHDETLLPQMLAALKTGADIAIGTRYAGGGGSGALDARRQRMSRSATWLSRFVLHTPLSDPMSGFFMLRRQTFESVVDALSGKGFKVLLDIVSSAAPQTRIVELPYQMRARRHGSSKLDLMALWEYALLMADKLIGRYIPVRFVLFVAVGMTGVVVHLAVLGLLFRVFGSGFALAQATAAAVAMTNNFVINNMFTYADRRLRGPDFAKGLLSFYAACAFGAVISVSLASLLFRHGLPWWLAGLIGAVAGSVWNYAVTATFTWGGRRRARPH